MHADGYKHHVWPINIPFLSQNAASLCIYHSVLLDHLWKLILAQNLGCEHFVNDNVCLMVCACPALMMDLLYGAPEEKLKPEN